MLFLLGKKKKSATAQVAGPNIAGTGADDNTIGTVIWQNPGNLTASDNTYVTQGVQTSTKTSHYLKATNFGFAIPVGATINGILVEIEYLAVGAGRANDSTVKIVQGDVVVGNNKGNNAAISTVESFVAYGGAADLWGASWSPADINAANFGAVFSVTFDPNNTGISIRVFVDSVRITVYYTA